MTTARKRAQAPKPPKRVFVVVYPSGKMVDGAHLSKRSAIRGRFYGSTIHEYRLVTPKRKGKRK